MGAIPPYLDLILPGFEVGVLPTLQEVGFRDLSISYAWNFSKMVCECLMNLFARHPFVDVGEFHFYGS